MNVEEILRYLERDGVVRVREVLSTDEVKKVGREIENYVNEFRSRIGLV